MQPEGGAQRKTARMGISGGCLVDGRVEVRLRSCTVPAHTLHSVIMRQYRPTIEQLKKRYSSDMARRKMQQRRDATRDPAAKRIQTPDNSEPWLPHPVRSLAEAMWISDQITADMIRWKLL
jgi:hypothetical protein